MITGDDATDLGVRATAPSPQLVDRLILSGAVAAVVATAAILRDAAAWAVVAAAAVAVAAFWLIDRFVSPRWMTTHLAPGSDSVSPTSAAAAEVELPPVLDAGRVRDDSVDATDLATGRTHIYRVRLAAHGEPVSDSPSAAHVDARTASLAVAAPVEGTDADVSASTAWCERVVRRFTDDAPKPLSIGAFDEWLDTTRSDPAVAGAAPVALAGASLMSDRGSRVAMVMTVGDAAAIVVSAPSDGPGDDGPRVRAVVRSAPIAVAGESPTGLSPARESVTAPPVSWTSVQVEPGDRLVVATGRVADWLTGRASGSSDGRLALLDRATAVEIGAGLSDERIAGRLADGSAAFAVVSLAP